MRKILTLSTLFLLAGSAFGQVLNPVKWSFSSNHFQGNEYNLVFTAAIEDKWTVYSQFLESDEGPVPTSFTFEDGGHFSRIGKVEESPENRKTIQDEVFKMQVTKFYHKATFTQRVKMTDFSKPVSGFLEFMTCDDKKCLAPKEIDFSFQLKPVASASTKPAEPVKGAELSKKQTTASPPAEVKSTTTPSVPVIQNTGSAGILEPVHWSFQAQKISEGEYDLVFKAVMDKPWTIYSQFLPEGDGPIPTTFIFEQNGNVELVGKATEAGNKSEEYDQNFGMKLAKFKGEAVFTQRVKVKDATLPVKGYVDFMTCDDKQCIPKGVDFAIPLGGETAVVSTIETPKDDANFKGFFQTKRAIDKNQVVNDCGITVQKTTSLWWTFVLGLLGGLVALLTPCVFPMVPITVGFFTKSSKTRAAGIRNALWYGASIIIIYVSIGLILTAVFGPRILNEMSTDMYFNLLFFAVFVLFALSFFGLFEITLPSSWMNKADSVAGKGGLIGIFFMAFTLALVSFSCTGPIIGSVLPLVMKDTLTAGVAMFGFALSLALPFGFFAAFPSYLNSLPRSGAWMNNVKVTLGFLELALALKFLSTADMVRHWEFLKFELFLGLWVLIFLGLALYQFGFLKIGHEPPLKKIPPSRWVVGLLSLAFVAYLADGLYNYKPLALLSGLAPPAHYNFFRPGLCPHGLDCYKDFDEAIAVAKQSNKPLFVDFTGYGCVNCRKMEETVWVKPEILAILKNDYVVVSLYCDDQKRLFPDEKLAYLLDSDTGEKIRSVGAKWANFQISNFGSNSQPIYALMSNDGTTLLTNPVGFTPGVKEYKQFLECGLDAFRKVQSARKM